MRRGKTRTFGCIDAMIVRPPLRQVARVDMHLPGGFTRVILFNLGGHWWDIPTDKIPPRLRGIGSEFVVIMPGFAPEEADTPEAIRKMCEQVTIEELGDTQPLR